MGDLFDELRDQVDRTPEVVRGKLAQHLKQLCREIEAASTSGTLSGNLPSLNTTTESATAVVRKAFHPQLSWTSPLNLRRFVPHYSTSHGAAFNEDSMKVLKALPSASVDLVLTSLPFALTRKKEYGNEPLDRYLECR